MENERIWENKALREARESSHKNAVSLLDVAERLGLLKHITSIEELFTEFNGIRNKLFDQIYQDIPLHADELFKQPETKKELEMKDNTLLTVFLSDGTLKTIDVKDILKKDGFKWDTGTKTWSKTMSAKDWDFMSRTIQPYTKLHADINIE